MLHCSTLSQFTVMDARVRPYRVHTFFFKQISQLFLAWTHQFASSFPRKRESSVNRAEIPVFTGIAASLRERIIREVPSQALGNNRKKCVNPVGAGAGTARAVISVRRSANEDAHAGNRPEPGRSLALTRPDWCRAVASRARDGAGDRWRKTDGLFPVCDAFLCIIAAGDSETTKILSVN